MYKVFSNYGYNSEELIAECDTLGHAINYFRNFISEWAQPGERVEIISFADDGEAVTYKVWPR